MADRTIVRLSMASLSATLAVLTSAILCTTTRAADPLLPQADRGQPLQAVPFDLSDNSWFVEQTPGAVAMMIGPMPCDSCDPLDLDNPLSPNYDPTILAIYQEDDLLPPPEGPGVSTCNGLGVDGPFWAGANDQCSGPATSSGRDIANIDTQIPALVPGAHYSICGQVGAINTSGFTGDPNNPGGALKAEDADFFELHIPSDAIVKLTGYFQATKIRCGVVFNIDLYGETGTFGRLRDCTDQYGQFLSISWQPMNPSVPCENGVWENYLSGGYFYLYVDPLSSLAQGVPGNQLCEYWYNVEIEVFSADGACCFDTENGYVCQDALTSSECNALGNGIFEGTGSTCAEVVCPGHPCCLGPNCAEHFTATGCAEASGTYRPEAASCATAGCTPTGACCFSCTSAVAAPCPDPSGPVVGCLILTEAQCLAARGLYIGDSSTCAQGIGGPCDCAGDINGDGNCNTSDFNILAGSFGQGIPNCRTHAQGDLNCDGVVNTADFNILAGNFGCIRN